jgi:hypothetical protein
MNHPEMDLELSCKCSSKSNKTFFPASLPTPVLCGVANDGYSNRGEVES